MQINRIKKLNFCISFNRFVQKLYEILVDFSIKNVQKFFHSKSHITLERIGCDFNSVFRFETCDESYLVSIEYLVAKSQF